MQPVIIFSLTMAWILVSLFMFTQKKYIESYKSQYRFSTLEVARRFQMYEFIRMGILVLSFKVYGFESTLIVILMFIAIRNFILMRGYVETLSGTMILRWTHIWNAILFIGVLIKHTWFQG